MIDPFQFPNLRNRAYQLLVEGSGEASDAELVQLLFGGQGAPWRAMLEGVLDGDPRFARTATGWRLEGVAATWVKPEAGVALDRFVALVVLATGPQPPIARAVAVGAVRAVAGRVAERGQWLFRPEPPPRRLPADIARSGIALEEIVGAPTFAAGGAELIAFLADAPIVGLDVALQVAFLQYEARRAGWSALGNPLVELSALAEAHLDSRPDLARLAGRLGVPPPRDRSPLGRAVCLGEVAVSLLGGQQPVPATPATRATQRRPLLDPATAETAPAEPGVYLFRDVRGTVLYVGKARSLRERLRTYCTSDLERSRHMSGLVAQAEAVDVRPTLSPLDAALLEARAIAHYRPPYNIQRRSGVRLVFARAEVAGGQVRLRWSDDPQGGIGPMRRAEAQAALAAARSDRPRPGGRTKAARELRTAWFDRIIADTANHLRQVSLPARLGADENGVVWLRDGRTEAGLAPAGWLGSRHLETGEWLDLTVWPEPPAPIAEWAIALALAVPGWRSLLTRSLETGVASDQGMFY